MSFRVWNSKYQAEADKMSEQNLQEKLVQCRKNKTAIEQQEKDLLQQIEQRDRTLNFGDIVTCENGLRIVLYDSKGRLKTYNYDGKDVGGNTPSYYRKIGQNIFTDNLLNLDN